MTKDEALQLTAKIASGIYTPEEVEAFLSYIRSADTDLVSELLDAYYTALNRQGHYQLYVEPDFISRLRALKPPEEKAPAAVLQTRWYSQRRWLSIAAASLILLLSAGGLYLWLNSNTSRPPEISRHIQNDVMPGGNKAILTLSNGVTIMLDSAHEGVLAQQGNTKILKLDSGQLAYEALEDRGGTAIQYNLLTTPRGGQYQIRLPDGTKVWLNSASSIRYPTAFTGKERQVEVTGEAYFEVAKDPYRPFTVNVNNMQVQVLGTHFNINAYQDEGVIKTTLLEGRVKVLSGNAGSTLEPGQQAQVSDHHDKIRVLKDVDTEEAVAWKNGYFRFDNADLPSLMQNLSRWYDVEVVYEGEITQHAFVGQIERTASLSKVLKILELGGVHFRIEGKKLIVTP